MYEMLEDLRGENEWLWRDLLGRNSRLRQAIRALHKAGPTSGLLGRAERAWRDLRSASWKNRLYQTCRWDTTVEEYAGADAEDLYANACRYFAAGVAAFCLRHLEVPAVAGRLPDWLRHAADPEEVHPLPGIPVQEDLLPPAAGGREEDTAAADLSPRAVNQRVAERLRVLAQALPERVDYSRVELLLCLEHWLRQLRLVGNPTEPLFVESHEVRVPCVSWIAYEPENPGQIHDLCLSLRPTGPPQLLRHPKLWNRPFAKEWLDTLRVAFKKGLAFEPGKSPGSVVWSYETRKHKEGGSRELFTMTGDSHMAAARVGFRVLFKGLEYDRGCLIAATVKEDDATLDGVGELKNKCDTAKRFGLDRVIIAADPEPDLKEEMEIDEMSYHSPPLRC